MLSRNNINIKPTTVTSSAVERRVPNMTNIYNHILKSKAENEKLLAILLDPDKIDLSNIETLTEKINQSPATHIFIGGSLVKTNILDELISKI
jgi:putative glycerol-1-phosphate prenyltransferase